MYSWSPKLVVHRMLEQSELHDNCGLFAISKWIWESTVFYYVQTYTRNHRPYFFYLIYVILNREGVPELFLLRLCWIYIMYGSKFVQNPSSMLQRQ